MIIGVVILLVVIIIVLMIYNMQIHKKIENYTNINQKITSLSVLQDFMDTISESSSVDDKIKKINDILIERYDIKYSTIVVFNGTKYVLKASNVDEKHWGALTNLHTQPIFQDSIQTATPKYVTVSSEEERLPYQQMEFGRAKSAMFFPLYIENVYIGYWIIESSKAHAFDNIDTALLEVVRNNIVSVLKTVENQKTIENIARDDKFSGLKSAEYLYGAGKKVIDKYTTSAICMFKIVNLEKINEITNRKTGDRTIEEVSKIIKSNISSEYIFVRYMGPKFVIAFSGVEQDGVIDFIKTMKETIESTEIERVVLEGEKKPKVKETITPKLNFVITTYYKGTGIEEVAKKLEEYLDHTDQEESNINYI